MASTSSVFNTKDLHFDLAPPITTSLPRWRPLYHQAAIDLALRVKGAVHWEVIGNGSVYSSITKTVPQNATIKKAHETYFTSLNVQRRRAGLPFKSCLDHITALTVYNLLNVGYYFCFICSLKQYGWQYQVFRKLFLECHNKKGS